MAMLYRKTYVDYTKRAKFVSKHLRTLPTGCYHGGVEMFVGGNSPKYRTNWTDDGGEAELTEWLDAEHGILVTHEPQFRGCEADAVIFVTKMWGTTDIDCVYRSPVTRAVAHLCLITGKLQISVKELKRHWEVEIMKD